MHLVDVTMFYCSRSGGVKRYLLSKREWLAHHARGVTHSLLVPAPTRASVAVRTCAGASLKLSDGYRFPLDARRWYSDILQMQPDVIEAADPYVPGWAARAAAARLRVPAIAFYHSDVPRLLEARVGTWAAPVARTYLRRFYAGFDLVLAPSALMLERLRTAGIEHAEIQPLGVDINTFRPQTRDPAFRTRLGLREDARLLVYAGRFAQEKNLPILTSAVERLGDPYHLLLIGGRRFERRGDRVTIIPYQRSSERLARLLANCDVFVHAGNQETYGLVAAEAMACGLPVVAVAEGAIAELVDESVGMLVRRLSAAAFAAEIANLFGRDLSSIGRVARTRATTSYAWDFVFRAMLSRYARLVSQGGLRPQHTAVARG